MSIEAILVNLYMYWYILVQWYQQKQLINNVPILCGRSKKIEAKSQKMNKILSKMDKFYFRRRNRCQFAYFFFFLFSRHQFNLILVHRICKLVPNRKSLSLTVLLLSHLQNGRPGFASVLLTNLVTYLLQHGHGMRGNLISDGDRLDDVDCKSVPCIPLL